MAPSLSISKWNPANSIPKTFGDSIASSIGTNSGVRCKTAKCAIAGGLPKNSPFDRLLCGCQVMNTRVLLFSYDSFSFPDQRETCCYAWHGTGPSHLLEMRPSL